MKCEMPDIYDSEIIIVLYSCYCNSNIVASVFFFINLDNYTPITLLSLTHFFELGLFYFFDVNYISIIIVTFVTKFKLYVKMAVKNFTIITTLPLSLPSQPTGPLALCHHCSG